MQKALIKNVKHKPNKPSKLKAQPKNWRKRVDWSAAGRKAYETRMKNQRKNGKVVKTQKKQPKPQKKPAAQKQVKQHGKRKTVGAFGNYRVNRDALVAELKKSKKTELAPTEVVSLTWNVIKKASANR